MNAFLVQRGHTKRYDCEKIKTRAAGYLEFENTMQLFLRAQHPDVVFSMTYFILEAPAMA